MTTRARVTRSAVAHVEALASQPLDRATFREWADGPIGPDELEESIALIRWFVQRYPTPAARLAWARRHTEASQRTRAHVLATSVVDNPE